MKVTELRSAVFGSCLNDIYFAGFVDPSERPLRFYALYRAVFVECGSVLLKFEVVADTGRMRVTRAEHVSCQNLDDDLEPAATSVRQVILDDPDGGNHLRRLLLWGVNDHAVGIECSAARFDLMNGQQIFVDPTYHFGIRLGGAQQQTVWMDNSLQREERPLEIGLER
jgi:hypothetical protein